MSDSMPTEIQRLPILLNEHTMALLTIFTFDNTSFDDLFAIDWLASWNTNERAAQELVRQLYDHGHVAPALLIAIRREITKRLRDEDAERNGKTDFEHAP